MNVDQTRQPASPQPAPRELVNGLFDDASLFPPGNLPMRSAVTAHGQHIGAWYHDLTGPFVCPETRIDELRAVLTAANVPEIDLALVVTGGAVAVGAATDAVAADPRLRLRAIEVSARRIQGSEPTTDSQADHEHTGHGQTDHGHDGYGHNVAEVAAALDAALLGGAAGYIEIPLGLLADPATADEVLSIVAGRGYRPKLRTGGMTAAAFPDEPTLAGALAAVERWNVPFKCTAGLHHAIRHTAADTGFEHHGFLNVLLAVGAAAADASQDQIAGLLAQRDPAQVAGQIRDLDPESAAEIRALFTSFGTCSTEEPIADLVGLGLINQP
jgi:hypothetical protein